MKCPFCGHAYHYSVCTNGTGGRRCECSQDGNYGSVIPVGFGGGPSCRYCGHLAHSNTICAVAHGATAQHQVCPCGPSRLAGVR